MPVSVLRFPLVLGGGGHGFFVELAGAVFALEFVAFAADDQRAERHHEQGKKFHRANRYPQGGETQPRSDAGSHDFEAREVLGVDETDGAAVVVDHDDVVDAV